MHSWVSYGTRQYVHEGFPTPHQKADAIIIMCDPS